MKLPVPLSYDPQRSHGPATYSNLWRTVAAGGVLVFFLGAVARILRSDDDRIFGLVNKGLLGAVAPSHRVGSKSTDSANRFPALSVEMANLPLRQEPLPWFDSLRVITMTSRPERRAHMEKLDAVLGLGFTYQPAVTIDDPRVPDRVAKWNVTKGWSIAADARQQACRLSHTEALLEADKANETATLVLEDDVDFELNFRGLAGSVLRDVPADWDMIFFGHTNLPGLTEDRRGLATEAHNPRVFVSVAPRGGHAYALSRKGRALMLSMLEDNNPERADTDGGFAFDQYFDIMAHNYIGKLYTVLPDIVVQVSGFESDIQPGLYGHDDYHDKPLVDPTRPLARAYAATLAKTATAAGGHRGRVHDQRSRRSHPARL